MVRTRGVRPTVWFVHSARGAVVSGGVTPAIAGLSPALSRRCPLGPYPTDHAPRTRPPSHDWRHRTASLPPSRGPGSLRGLHSARLLPVRTGPPTAMVRQPLSPTQGRPDGSRRLGWPSDTDRLAMVRRRDRHAWVARSSEHADAGRPHPTASRRDDWGTRPRPTRVGPGQSAGLAGSERVRLGRGQASVLDRPGHGRTMLSAYGYYGSSTIAHGAWFSSSD